MLIIAMLWGVFCAVAGSLATYLLGGSVMAVIYAYILCGAAGFLATATLLALLVRRED